MGDVAKGIKSFKKGMADDTADDESAEKAKLEQSAESKVGEKVKS